MMQQKRKKIKTPIKTIEKILNARGFFLCPICKDYFKRIAQHMAQVHKVSQWQRKSEIEKRMIIKKIMNSMYGKTGRQSICN